MVPAPGRDGRVTYATELITATGAPRELSRQRPAAAQQQQQEAEPLSPILQSARDGQQLLPGQCECINVVARIHRCYRQCVNCLLEPRKTCLLKSMWSRGMHAGTCDVINCDQATVTGAAPEQLALSQPCS